MVVILVLLFFGFALEAMSFDNELVLTAHVPRNFSRKMIDGYKEGTLQFTLTEEGYCGTFQNNEHEGDNCTKFSHGSVLNIVPSSALADEISPIDPELSKQVNHWVLPQTLFDVLFLKFSLKSNQYTVFHRFNTDRFVDWAVKLPDALDQVKECYWNKTSGVLYYLNKNNEMRYVDCALFPVKWNQFFQPIINIKHNSTTNCNLKRKHFLHIPKIWKDVFLFLKHYFYDAYGNKRLQRCLYEAFLNNAGIVFVHLLPLYYGGIVFLLSRSNASVGIVLAKMLALVHFAVHIRYNYVSATKRN